MGAAILHLMVCISDTIKKAGMCGKALNTSRATPFLLFTGKGESNMAVPWAAHMWSQKVLLLYKQGMEIR